MGADDKSFLDLLDTSGGDYDLDELCGQVEKILSTSTTSASNNQEKGKSAVATIQPHQPEQRESTGSHRKREQEEQQRPAEQKPMKEMKRVEYQPQRLLPAADDAMKEVVKSSSGRAKRPRIQLPEERETTIRASSSKSATRIFKFRAGATDDEMRMQRKLRFSGADHHRHEKANKRGGGEVYDVRAGRTARYGTTAATPSASTREEGAKRRATAAASGGADAGALKRLGVPMKSRKDLP